MIGLINLYLIVVYCAIGVAFVLYPISGALKGGYPCFIANVKESAYTVPWVIVVIIIHGFLSRRGK